MKEGPGQQAWKSPVGRCCLQQRVSQWTAPERESWRSETDRAPPSSVRQVYQRQVYQVEAQKCQQAMRREMLVLPGLHRASWASLRLRL